MALLPDRPRRSPMSSNGLALRLPRHVCIGPIPLACNNLCKLRAFIFNNLHDATPATPFLSRFRIVAGGHGSPRNALSASKPVHPHHLSSLFSLCCALFGAMEPLQLLSYQSFAHSFPFNGGVGLESYSFPAVAAQVAFSPQSPNNELMAQSGTSSTPICGYKLQVGAYAFRVSDFEFRLFAS